MYRSIGTGLVLVGLLIFFCLKAILPLSEEIKLGLDLKGGTLLQYRLDLSKVPPSEQSSVADEVKSIIYRRLDRYGLKEIEIRRVGRDRIQVAIPGVSQEEVEGIKAQVEQTGQLTIHLVKDQNPSQDKIRELQKKEAEYEARFREWLASGAKESERPQEPDEIVRPKHKKDPKTRKTVLHPRTKQPVIERYVVLHNEPELRVSGRYIRSARPITDPQTGLPAVSFEFQPEGARQFGALTKAHVKEYLAIVLDNVIQSIAIIRQAIYDRGQITGDFRVEEAKALANILSVGSLPTKPMLMQEQTVGARLGHDSIVRGETSIVLGFFAVVLFMALYYMKAGIIADVALFFNLILILAYVATFGQSLSFPGIAGVLLTVGMAVDANILIFERIREELKKGKPLDVSAATGYDRAFWTIFDANATTFITGLVLFKVGSGPVQGFAITLMAGLVANFLTALYVSRLFLSVLHRLGALKSLRMLQLFETPSISFIKHAKKFATCSVLLIVVALVVLFWRGADVVGIDFRGGMEIALNLSKPIEIDEFRTRLTQIEKNGRRLFGEAQVQATASAEGGLAHGFIIRVPFQQFMAQVQQGKGKVASAPCQHVTLAGFLPLGTEAEAPAPAKEQPGEKSAPAKEEKTRPPGKKPATAPPRKVAEKTPQGTEQPQGKEEKKAPPAGTAPAKTKQKAPGPPPEETPRAGAAPSMAAPAAPEGGITEEARELYRTALEVTFSDILAPEAFPESGDRPYPVNPDLGKIAFLEVNLFRGESPDPVVLQFASQLPDLFAQYLRRRAEERQKNLNLPPVRDISIAEVKVAPEQKYPSYVTYEISTLPIRYGQGNAPVGVNEAVSELKRFFMSQFYEWRLAQEDMAEYRSFFIAERIPRMTLVDSAVAADFQGAAMMAILVSLLAIVFYIGIRFELTFGFGAVAALVHDVLFGLGALAVVDYLLGDFFAVKIDLPAIAAFLTIIGYSLNDTIVVFDRIRENTRRLKKYVLEDVVDQSINQTLSRTLLTSLTTFVVVLILLLGGGPTVQGFAFIMLVGVVVGTYSSVFIASPAMIYLTKRRAQKREERIAAASKHVAKASR